MRSTFTLWLAFLLVGPAATIRAQSPVATDPDGFSLPQPGRQFEFPRDHGSHPDFKIEWWYVTGHLWTSEQQRFGFQATFFRRASPDRSTHIYLAHMGVIDVQTGRFLHQERLDREGWDAGAATERLELHHGPWSLRMTGDETETMELHGGVAAEARFELTLRPTKPLVVFGEEGVSRKGADPTAASHYLTFTRLNVTGRLEWQGAWREVTGQAWMDHEISSSQLSSGQIGWDWVSVQLRDGRDVMVYQLRRSDGSADEASTLTWIDRDGGPVRAPFEWTVLKQWRSRETGATYPSQVQITTSDPATGAPVVFVVAPLVAAQELPGELSGIPYWEGACRVLDANGAELGSAYMELTGYAKPLSF